MPCHHKAMLVKKLINFQYFRLGELLVLLLCTIVLCTINSQNSVSAQHSSSIEQDLKIFGTDAILPNTYPSTDHSGVDDRSHGSKGGSDAQGTNQEDEITTPAEKDEITTPAEEEIEGTWNNINDSLNESGIFGLDIR
jgi:hypothetical protein